MTLADDRILVLYIAGAGRSGSTALDLLLGSYPGVASLGEVRFIWKRGVLEGQRCGCGQPIRNCQLWGEVLGAHGWLDEPAAAKAAGLVRAMEARRGTLWMLRDELPKQRKNAAERYIAQMELLYGAVAQRTGASMLVDSSKWPTLPLVLRHSRKLAVHVIHLVRDSRAVAYSWQRKKRRPEIIGREAFMATFSPYVAARGWAIANSLCEVARWKVPYLRMRYEDFARAPEKAVGKVENWLRNSGNDIYKGQLHGDCPKVLDPQSCHTVSGNPIRLAKGALRIRPDEEWKKGLRRRDFFLVTMMTWPWLVRYGYRCRKEK